MLGSTKPCQRDSAGRGMVIGKEDRQVTLVSRPALWHGCLGRPLKADEAP